MVLVLKYVSEEEDYFNQFILDKIKKHNGKICYISFNRSYQFLKKYFIENKIDMKNIYFIDGVTKLLKEPMNKDKCRFILPYDIKNLEKYTVEFVNEGCNLVIFDSLSSLMVYQQYIPAGMGIMTHFIKSFNKDLVKNNGNAIFICKTKDKKNFLIEETVRIFKICNYGEEDVSCK